jgi:hypothetical protein
MLIGEHFTVTFRGDAVISEAELKNAATWETSFQNHSLQLIAAYFVHFDRSVRNILNG